MRILRILSPLNSKIWKIAFSSQQRTIVDCLARQSRDSYSDVTCCLMDGMSNKCSKLPSLGGRPKSIGDPHQLGLNLTTVQLCEAYGRTKILKAKTFPSFRIQFVQEHRISYFEWTFQPGLKFQPVIILPWFISASQHFYHGFSDNGFLSKQQVVHIPGRNRIFFIEGKTRQKSKISMIDF